MKVSVVRLLVIMMVGFGLAGCQTKPVKIPDSSAPVESETKKIFRDPLPFEVSLPDGFVINYYAREVPGARSLTLADDGTVFVGTRSQGVVYALLPNHDLTAASSVLTILSELDSPNGVAFLNGDLYVAEINRVLKYGNILDSLSSPPTPEVIISDLPSDQLHGWKFMAIGPDNRIYVPVGAPCNSCDRDDPYAALLSYDINGSDKRIVARGIRNTVGFDWQPGTRELWFSDNGRDGLGDNLPPDELNRISSAGLNYGYPYCHGRGFQDPQLGANIDCGQYESPVLELGSHVAALGISFYTGGAFPAEYKNRVFIAEHGSWDRSEKVGYRVTMADVNGSLASGYRVFAEGWLDGDKKTVYGRPVDVLVMPDGSLLVSDDFAGAVYRISYSP